MDLERKRARDRRSQQAMRDRRNGRIQGLTDHVDALKKSLQDLSTHAQNLNHRLQQLETENDHLRVQNAALRLSLLGESDHEDTVEVDDVAVKVPVWRLPPNNTPASNLADSILQDVVKKRRAIRLDRDEGITSPDASSSPQVPLTSSNYPSKPNLCALLDKDTRADDDISNIVSDIIRSYGEISALPNRVGQAFAVTMLLRWQVLLDETSWNMIPDWLKPTQAQFMKPHAAWIDRLPWRTMREYFIEHPDITLDDLAVVYSSSFNINWPYDHAHVLVHVDDQSNKVVTNPIFEEHLRDLKNWTVGEAFKLRFPELARQLDEESNSA